MQLPKLFISETEAAERYSYSRSWFQRSRWEGSGPKFLKVKGRILYPVQLTDDWFSNHGLKSSTTDVAISEEEERKW